MYTCCTHASVYACVIIVDIYAHYPRCTDIQIDSRLNNNRDEFEWQRGHMIYTRGRRNSISLEALIPHMYTHHISLEDFIKVPSELVSHEQREDTRGPLEDEQRTGEPCFVHRPEHHESVVDEREVAHAHFALVERLDARKPETSDGRVDELPAQTERLWLKLAPAQNETIGRLIIARHTVSRAGDELEELWARVDKVDNLREEEEKHRLGVVPKDGGHGERHARKIAIRVADENLGGVPVVDEDSTGPCHPRSGIADAQPAVAGTH